MLGSVIILCVPVLDGRSNWIKLFIQLKCSSKLGWIHVCDLVPCNDGSKLTEALLIGCLVQSETFDNWILEFCHHSGTSCAIDHPKRELCWKNAERQTNLSKPKGIFRSVVLVCYWKQLGKNVLISSRICSSIWYRKIKLCRTTVNCISQCLREILLSVRDRDQGPSSVTFSLKDFSDQNCLDGEKGYVLLISRYTKCRCAHLHSQHIDQNKKHPSLTQTWTAQLAQSCSFLLIGIEVH